MGVEDDVANAIEFGWDNRGPLGDVAAVGVCTSGVGTPRCLVALGAAFLNKQQMAVNDYFDGCSSIGSLFASTLMNLTELGAGGLGRGAKIWAKREKDRGREMTLTGKVWTEGVGTLMGLAIPGLNLSQSPK